MACEGGYHFIGKEQIVQGDKKKEGNNFWFVDLASGVAANMNSEVVPR